MYNILNRQSLKYQIHIENVGFVVQYHKKMHKIIKEKITINNYLFDFV